MKTSFFRHVVLTGTGLFVSSAFVMTAFAGPGPQYWQNVGKSAATAEQNPTSAPAAVCPGSKLVAVTAMKSAWANGKGPLVEKQVGTKRVCTVCPVTNVATTGWANGRGPDTKTATTTTGTPHDCTAGCPAAKS